MSRDLNHLHPEFREGVIILLERCKEQGVIMTPYSTFRDVHHQARIWRQGRSTREIKAKLKYLRRNSASFLADVIDSVGPQKGRSKRTNAIPGLSWHNWGLAVDCFWNVDGDARWIGPGYKVYADTALNLGMDAGFYWKTITDSPHVQRSKQSSPLSAGFSLQYISEEMENLHNQGVTK